MSSRRFQTIEGRQEVPLQTVIVDVRSNEQKVADWVSQPRHFSFVMGTLAFLCVLLPHLLPIWLFALVIGADIYGNAAQYLPFRYPAWSKTQDPGQLDPKTGRPSRPKGVMYFGVIDAADPYERNKQVFASADDLTRHMLVLGTTGSGKSEFLKAMIFNVLCWASGFFVSDAKADNKLPTDVYSQVRMFLRDYDFLVINYLLGGLSPSQISGMRERLSNGLQPATVADADTLVQMMSNTMVKASGDSKTWQERGLNLFKGITRALCWKRDEGHIVLSMELLREYLSLDKIEELYIEGWEMANNGQSKWPTPFLGVKSYLEVGLPGFKIDVMLRKHGKLKEEAEEDPLGPMAAMRGPQDQKKKAPTSQSNDTFNQHGYRSDQVYPALSLLIDTYGHIFKRKFPEVDMQDVVTNNRICVALIPSLEKGSQEQESLGKLNLALLRVMMARALGMSVEGDVHKIVDAKITASNTPFALFLDEFAYQFAEGIALTAAQARSLNFFLCALAQDLEKLTEGDRAAEAGAMMANQATKFIMKIVGSDKTHDLAEKTLGKADVAVLSDMERDTDFFSSVRRGKSYRFEKRSRIEREVLENLPSGIATFAYRQRAHVMKSFYPTPDIPRVRFPRINRFLQIPEIESITLATCAVDMNPSEDTVAIERVRRVIDSSEVPQYAEVITSDILQRIIEASKNMKPQTPPIERGIVLYQAGLRALSALRQGASMLGQGVPPGGGGGPAAKPPQAVAAASSTPAQVSQVPDVPQVPVVPTAIEAGQSAVSPQGSGATPSTDVAPGTVLVSSSVTQQSVTGTSDENERAEPLSAEEQLASFDPLLALANLAPSIVRKPKEEVFEVAAPAATEVSGDRDSTGMAVDTGSVKSATSATAQTPNNDDHDGISGEIFGDDVAFVMGDPDVLEATGSGATADATSTPAVPVPTAEQMTHELQQLVSGIVNPEIVAHLGQEVVGLRDASKRGIAKVEQALGATEQEAMQAAENTEKVVAQSLLVMDNGSVSATASDVDLLFNELNNVINQN
jgi:intracellular multiplication protein IcmO